MKAVTLIGIVYYREKIQIKASHGKKHIESSPGKVPDAELSLASPHGARDSSTFLALIRGSTYCQAGN